MVGRSVGRSAALSLAGKILKRPKMMCLLVRQQRLRGGDGDRGANSERATAQQTMAVLSPRGVCMISAGAEPPAAVASPS